MRESSVRDALPIGTELGDYVIEAVVGQGGFGVVYRATHLDLGTLAALKEYMPSTVAVRIDGTVYPRNRSAAADFKEGLGRFKNEARRLVQFRSHPGIVSCLGFFEERGTAYMVMDYEDGLPLSELLTKREAAGRPLDEGELLRIAEQVLRSLMVVHRGAVLHRDIKPSNILIRRSDDRPVLIDFGAAKVDFGRHSKSMAPHTQGYAAIEQIEAEGALGPWTDLYGLGAVLWRIVAGGRPPIEPLVPVDALSRTAARFRGQPDPLPSARKVGAGRFSTAVLEAIDKCLRVEPEDRPKRCQEALPWLSESGVEQANGREDGGLGKRTSLPIDVERPKAAFVQAQEARPKQAGQSPLSPAARVVSTLSSRKALAGVAALIVCFLIFRPEADPVRSGGREVSHGQVRHQARPPGSGVGVRREDSTLSTSPGSVGRDSRVRDTFRRSYTPQLSKGRISAYGTSGAGVGGTTRASSSVWSRYSAEEDEESSSVYDTYGMRGTQVDQGTSALERFMRLYGSDQDEDESSALATSTGIDLEPLGSLGQDEESSSDFGIYGTRGTRVGRATSALERYRRLYGSEPDGDRNSAYGTSVGGVLDDLDSNWGLNSLEQGGVGSSAYDPYGTSAGGGLRSLDPYTSPFSSRQDGAGSSGYGAYGTSAGGGLRSLDPYTSPFSSRQDGVGSSGYGAYGTSGTSAGGSTRRSSSAWQLDFP